MNSSFKGCFVNVSKSLWMKLRKKGAIWSEYWSVFFWKHESTKLGITGETRKRRGGKREGKRERKRVYVVGKFNLIVCYIFLYICFSFIVTICSILHFHFTGKFKSWIFVISSYWLLYDRKKRDRNSTITIVIDIRYWFIFFHLWLLILDIDLYSSICE